MINKSNSGMWPPINHYIRSTIITSTLHTLFQFSFSFSFPYLFLFSFSLSYSFPYSFYFIFAYLSPVSFLSIAFCFSKAARNVNRSNLYSLYANISILDFFYPRIPFMFYFYFQSWMICVICVKKFALPRALHPNCLLMSFSVVIPLSLPQL